jgi:hypothetical protein
MDHTWPLLVPVGVWQQVLLGMTLTLATKPTFIPHSSLTQHGDPAKVPVATTETSLWTSTCPEMEAEVFGHPAGRRPPGVKAGGEEPFGDSGGIGSLFPILSSPFPLALAWSLA